MRKYIIRRLGYSTISLVLLSLTIFFFVRVTGDPAVLLVEPGASKADLEQIRQQFGLDRPLFVQYGHFVSALVRGDFGQSFYYRTPVLELYLSRLPNSLMLAAAAMTLSLLIGIPVRHPRRRPRQRLVGPGREDLLAARAVAALVLGRPGDDPVLLRLPRVAALLGCRHGLAS